MRTQQRPGFQLLRGERELPVRREIQCVPVSTPPGGLETAGVLGDQVVGEGAAWGERSLPTDEVFGIPQLLLGPGTPQLVSGVSRGNSSLPKLEGPGLDMEGPVGALSGMDTRARDGGVASWWFCPSGTLSFVPV